MQGAKMIQCGHCGKRTVFHVRGQGTKYGAVLDDPHKTQWDGQTITTWRILECAVCLKPTLVEETVEYSFDQGFYRAAEIDAAEAVVLYPEPGARTALTNLPTAIEKAYRGALAVQDIEPNLCAVAAGRTLEAVCKHEKAIGKTLAEKLDDLVKSDRIPRTLAEMAHQLRQIRNLGAHATEDEVTELDVPIILHFVEAILEYLYVAPAKIAAVQARLTKTDDKKGRGTEKNV